MKYPTCGNTKEPIRREDGEFTAAVTCVRNRVRLRQGEAAVAVTHTTSTNANADTNADGPRENGESEGNRGGPLLEVSPDKLKAGFRVPLVVNQQLKDGVYTVVGRLGQGVFGQVLECRTSRASTSFKGEEKHSPEIEEDSALELLFDSGESVSHGIDLPESVAVKVIDKRPKYLKQALEEIKLLRKVLKEEENYEEFPIVRLLDNFEWNGHLCLAFEVLSTDLLEFYRSFGLLKGVPFRLLRPIVRQLLVALEILYNNGIIHCDVKPENILLEQNYGREEIRVKLIDFGSAMEEHRAILDNIQTIYYRAPEVIVGRPYDCSIDMWSLGCVIFELYTGYPIFPGKTDHDMLWLMQNALGKLPQEMSKSGRHAPNYFCKVQRKESDIQEKEYDVQLKSRGAWAEENDVEVKRLKTIFSVPKALEQEIVNWSYRDIEDGAAETSMREAFADLCAGLLRYESAKRWSPVHAKDHPFLTGEELDRPFNPDTGSPSSFEKNAFENAVPQSESESMATSQSREIYGAVHQSAYGFAEYNEQPSSSWMVSPPMRPQYPMPYYLVNPYHLHATHATSFPNSWQGAAAYHYVEPQRIHTRHQLQHVGSMPAPHHPHFTFMN